jgi:hypothetical protein
MVLADWDLTPFRTLAGGAMIGLSAALFMLSNGSRSARRREQRRYIIPGSNACGHAGFQGAERPENSPMQPMNGRVLRLQQSRVARWSG